MVSRSRGVVCRGRGVVCRSMDHRGMVSRSRGVVCRGMVDNRGVIGSSMVNSLVSVSGVSWGVGGWDSCGGDGCSRVFLRVVVGMDTLGSSMGLAMYSGGIGTMGLVDRVTH